MSHGVGIMTKFSEEFGADILSQRAKQSENDSITSTDAKVGDDEAHHQTKLTWRSWLAVAVSCWAQLAQVYVVAGAGQNIAFIARDIGNPDLAGWIVRKYCPWCIGKVLTRCRIATTHASSSLANNW